MKDALITVAVLLGFLFMVTDYWLMSGLLILYAVVAAVIETERKYHRR